PPVLGMVIAGLGCVTAAFLATHASLSGWVVERAGRRGIGTAQASSAYLLVYYLGSTIIGAAAAQQWQTSGWAGVETLALALAGLAAGAVFAASRIDANPRATESNDAPLG
ncbi:MAG: hypothetical protein LBK28_07455, partial [Propionibacteriaceae bacterium]|nr:hypothetical protein [Propionibacteriaceae bacterium]